MHSIRHWAALGRCSDLWCVYLMWPPNRTECGSTQLSYHRYLRLPPNKVRKNKPQNELTHTHTHTRIRILSHPRKLGLRLESDIIKFYNISMRLHFN